MLKALVLAALFWAWSPDSVGASQPVTAFWKPWFFDLGGATPIANAPFLELSGDLVPGTTLCIQCWGLQQPDDVRLVAGGWLDPLPGPGGAVLVPHPDLVVPVEVRTFDDDGSAGPLPSCAVLELAIPFGSVTPAGPGACLQVWAKTGPTWTASNAVAASFSLAAQPGP